LVPARLGPGRLPGFLAPLDGGQGPLDLGLEGVYVDGLDQVVHRAEEEGVLSIRIRSGGLEERSSRAFLA
jgi:hypothetical protein